jgi:glutathione S-transferase
MSVILYTIRESGHSCKVALALALMGIVFEQRTVDLNVPREQRSEDFRRDSLFGDAPTIADVSCCAYLHWTDQADLDLAPWPAIGAWLDRLRSLSGWQAPYDRLESSQPIRSGTRT